MNDKITLTTFKKFIKENQGNLYIKTKNDFDGMTDSIAQNKGAIFEQVKKDDRDIQNTLGISGCWLVLGSRDYFTPYKDELYEGITVSNSCGCFIVSKKVNN